MVLSYAVTPQEVKFKSNGIYYLGKMHQLLSKLPRYKLKV